MSSLIRFLASPRTAIFLLLLLGLQSLLFLAGAKPIGALKTLGLQHGPSSLPFLVTLLLLFANQGVAGILRLLKKSRPSESGEEELPPTPSWTEDGEFLELEDEKPKKKIRVPHRPIAEVRETLDGPFRFKNTLALLHLLGFRVQELREEGEGKEVLEARLGNSTRLATFVLHLGAVFILGAALYNIGYAPTQRRLVWKGVETNLGSKTATPVARLLHKLKLRKSDQFVFPSYALKLDSLNAEFQTRHLLQRPKEPLKRWMAQLNDLALKPKALTATPQKRLRAIAVEANVTVGKKQRKQIVRLGKAQLLGPYRISITQLAVQAQLNGSDGSKLISTEKPLRLGDGSTLHLVHFASGTMRSGQAIQNPCLAFVHKKKGKTLWEGCVPRDRSFALAGASFQWSQEPRVGAVFQYQTPNSLPLFGGSVFLFVLGFVLFWWPRRYTLLLTVEGGRQQLHVTGSGLNAAPHSLALGFEKTLHVEAPPRPKAPRGPAGPGSGGPRAGGQTPPPRAVSQKKVAAPSPVPAAPASAPTQQTPPRPVARKSSAPPQPVKKPQPVPASPHQTQKTLAHKRPEPVLTRATQKEPTPAQKPPSARAAQAPPAPPSVEKRGTGKRPAPAGPPVQRAQGAKTTPTPVKARPQVVSKAKPQTQPQPAPKKTAPAKPQQAQPNPKAAQTRPQPVSKKTSPAKPQQAQPNPKAAQTRPQPAPKKTAPAKPQQAPPTPKATIPNAPAVSRVAKGPSVSEKAKQQTAPSPFQPKPTAPEGSSGSRGSVSKTRVTAKPGLKVGSGDQQSRKTDEFAAASITKVVAEKKQKAAGPRPPKKEGAAPSRPKAPAVRTRTAPQGSPASKSSAKNLDVDSLFDGLGAEQTELRPGGKRVENKPVLKELDIDALFQDFDQNMEPKKK